MTYVRADEILHRILYFVFATFGPYQPLNLFPVLAVRYVRRGKDQKSVSGVAPETPISAPFVWNILSYFAYGSEVWKAY